jgi:hypothetical protein
LDRWRRLAIVQAHPVAPLVTISSPRSHDALHLRKLFFLVDRTGAGFCGAIESTDRSNHLALSNGFTGIVNQL